MHQRPTAFTDFYFSLLLFFFILLLSGETSLQMKHTVLIIKKQFSNGYTNGLSSSLPGA